MANGSPSSRLKQLDTQIIMILRKLNSSELNEHAAKSITLMRQAIAQAKIYTSDYELSEMREEQLDHAKTAKKYLAQAHHAILKASEFNVFGAVDTAHLTAQIDTIIAELK